MTTASIPAQRPEQPTLHNLNNLKQEGKPAAFSLELRPLFGVEDERAETMRRCLEEVPKGYSYLTRVCAKLRGFSKGADQ